MSGVVIGAGGVTNASVAPQCIEVGAHFLTSDGLHPEVVDLAAKREVVVISGALTPTEVISAWGMSSDFAKVVPCAQIGGETYIASLSRMYPHIPLIAAGGQSTERIEIHSHRRYCAWNRSRTHSCRSNPPAPARPHWCRELRDREERPRSPGCA
jgi:2-keto-3-deoxy-6-phosphogluconate aldolase